MHSPMRKQVRSIVEVVRPGMREPPQTFSGNGERAKGERGIYSKLSSLAERGPHGPGVIGRAVGRVSLRMSHCSLAQEGYD